MTAEPAAAIARGLLYALGAFAFGFLLGPPREFLLAPAIGRLAATLAELPVMLGFCWWLAGRVARPLPPGRGRLLLGAAALALLLLAEFVVGVFLRGWGPGAWLRHFLAPEGALTALAYLVFALLPWLRGPTPWR